MKALFAQGKRNALLMGVLTLLLCLVLGDGLLGMVSYRDDPTMRALVVLPGIAVFLVGLFLPPWLFRKTVHRRDTFWNLPLYFLAFFPLRSFFEDRVFLTQHFFLRKYFPGFFSFQGEWLLLSLLLVGILWGAQWFALEGSSNASELIKGGKKSEPFSSAERKEQRNRFATFFILGAFTCTVIFVVPLAIHVGIKTQEECKLDKDITVQFDQTGTAYLYFNSDYAFGKTFYGVDLRYLSHSPSESVGDITVILEIPEENDGPYIPYQRTNGDNPYEADPIWMNHDTDYCGGHFFLPQEYEGIPQNCRFVIRSDDSTIQEAAFHIVGWKNGF